MPYAETETCIPEITSSPDDPQSLESSPEIPENIHQDSVNDDRSQTANNETATINSDHDNDEVELNDVLGKLSEEFRSVAQGLEMLHNLNLVDFVAYEEEFVYIKGLLAFFPALEEVVIRRSEACDCHENFENYKEKLLHLKCASTKAKITVIG
nr:uncharacterized protein LOC109147210 [Ipomoea trifida]